MSVRMSLSHGCHYQSLIKEEIMRLVDADALYEKLDAIRVEEVTRVGRKSNKSCCTLSTALYEIMMMPTIEERKTGKWLPENRTMDAFWVCSECGFPSEAHAANILYNYCPNCGSYNGGDNNG